MRSSVSYMLSHGSGEPTMSHPDYEQHAHHHGSLLVLVRGIGSSKPRSLQTIFERLQKVNNVKISDANGHQRDIWVRFVQEHPVENNDWGDFQTHRRLLGLITVGKFDTQSELNELCRVHESLKVKYTNTLFDSRCLLFGGKKRAASQTPSIPTDSLNSYDSSNSASTDGGHTLNSISSLGTTNSNAEDSLNSDDSSIQKLKGTFSKPSVLQSQAFFYPENDACLDLEANIVEFVNSLFWILESKRLKKSQEKIDKVVLLQAPFEKKDFVGLDLDTRNNRKRCMGRVTKHLADLTLQAGLVAESLTLYHSASDTLRAISDSLWLGAASEGLCAASAILLYPNCQSPSSLQRNASLPNDGTTATNNRSLDNGKRPLPNASGVEPNDAVLSPINSASSSNSSVSSMLLSSSSSGGTLSANDPPNILPPDEIVARYRDAIINYSKYRHAGIIETEAALKAARICIEQNRNIDVSMFLQNVLYINLTMSEQERVHRFETLTQLYQDIGYKRKAAFCQRLAAWRHVAQSNSNPDWGQSYKLMLDSFGGHRLAMDPMEVLQNNAGWPCLQVDLVQQLVAAARRLGQSALATRHMTFMLQTMWRHLTAVEQREMALQLQSLSAQCEGAPVPLVLETGTVIPPANLTDLPRCEMFVVKELPSHLRPFKLVEPKASGPSHFLYTPLHFNQHSIDRRQTKKDYSKIAFQWIQNDLCEVTVRLKNPLPFELHVSDMRLLTNGVVFESLPQTVILAPAQPTLVTLHGTPIEHGSLEIQGYSTHALGVKSNCRLKAMIDRTFPPNYLVDVIPALPTLQLATSLPQTATFTGMPNADSVIVSASATIFNGESTDCVITLTNNSAVPITHLEESLQSTLDVKLQKLIFTWSPEELQSKLPIAPQTSVDFTVTIYAEADFLGPVIGIGSPYPPHPMSNDGPSSLNTHYASGNASLPSRVSSPVNMIQRRTEVSSSFRSTHSGHSSLATISLGAAAAGCSTVRHLDVQFRFRYSGGGGQQEGYCRQCAISFNLEFMPSAQVTNWDVLPAEIPSQFYLVLDVINLTNQEMTLNYTASKNIIIEARETCRIPVPVEKCPLDRLQSIELSEQNQTSMMSYGTESDLTEKACSEHISDQVNLNWTLSGTDTRGLCSLRGIALSSTMLGLITVAPLQWEIFINNMESPSQAEVTCSAGQSFKLGVKITNLSPTTLQQLQLTVQFYQDYQNGIQNYKLETRVILSGPDHIIIPKLDRNASAFHECTSIFFTPGRFKANIQCVSQQPIVTSHKPPTHNQHFSPFNSNGIPGIGVHKTRLATDEETQVWRFIPPLDITVTE